LVGDSWVERDFPEFTFGFDVFLAFFRGFFFAVAGGGAALF
jgi:hypothetical protein